MKLFNLRNKGNGKKKTRKEVESLVIHKVKNKCKHLKQIFAFKKECPEQDSNLHGREATSPSS